MRLEATREARDDSAIPFCEEMEEDAATSTKKFGARMRERGELDACRPATY